MTERISRTSGSSILDAIFGDLSPETRLRFKLTAPDHNSEPEITDPTKAGAILEDGNGPETPWQLSRASWVSIGKRVYAEISKDRVTSVSAGVTFFGLLALFPAITALVSLYGLFFESETIIGHLAMLERLLPAGAVEIIREQIVSIVEAPSKALGIATIIGLSMALYSANGGMKALVSALNIAWFETEKRGFVHLNALTLMFTLGAIIMIIIMLGLVAALPIVLDRMQFGRFSEMIALVLRWPMMIGALITALAVLYRWGPSKENMEWHWITPGAVFATAGLVIASGLFSWYAANFANYNETYGSLGAAIGLMMWLWIACMVVMMGAEVNSEVERQIEMENGIMPDDETAK